MSLKQKGGNDENNSAEATGLWPMNSHLHVSRLLRKKWDIEKVLKAVVEYWIDKRRMLVAYLFESYSAIRIPTLWRR